MANIYAIKSGLWSDTTVWNTGVLPDVVDDVFSNNFTVDIDISPTVLSISNAAASPIVAGGGFILNDNVTLTCTDTINGIRIGTVANNVLTYSGTITATINSHVIGGAVAGAANISKTGTGVLNIVGNISGNTRSAVQLGNTTGITNIVGDLTKTGGAISATAVLLMGASNTINITGNLNGDSGDGSTKQTAVSSGSNIINITGNVDGSLFLRTFDRVLTLATNDVCTILGTISGTNSEQSTNASAVFSQSPHILNVIGPIISTGIGCAIFSTNVNAINIFTGPFISHESGAQPLYVTRMHYQRTIGSYFEFRDDSTNGVLPPAAPAPATRLVSPETGADLPAQSDVRKGIVYALGTLEGTMNIPDPANVRKDIPVDDTVGTGVLDASGIFDVLTSSLTAPGSIGERLKNVSTVDTTGTQLQNLT